MRDNNPLGGQSAPAEPSPWAPHSPADWAPPSWLGEPSDAPAPGPGSESAPLEEPFRLPVQEVPRELWVPRPPAVERRQAPKPPRSLAFALPMVIVLGLLSAFFSWVSAEPLWLAVGHGKQGTATVTKCVGDGVTRRCQANFQTGEFSVARISLLGLTDATAVPGRSVAAHMVSERSQRAYAGGGFVLRWLPGLVLVLLCGLAIGLVTGVWRFVDKRERWAGFGVSMAAPLLVTIGFLAAAC